ncbi:MAG: oxygen-independent coproporphyrinogen III oxidase [Candidatus Omnitrophica bacterium]|nr:oxygen-independent coproporphyrinogen III oxidase [Candidatus Omnitrophota bacterium]
MSFLVDKQTLLKYDVPGPRYTSYPTAPQWSAEVDADVYAQRLRQFGQNGRTLSLYIHIPFCEQLCYFCACNKVIRPREEKIGDEYIGFLAKEIELAAKAIGRSKTVKQLHWGGGTPTYLNEEQTRHLFKHITDSFEVDFDGEIAIEIDPRTAAYHKLKVLRELGFNRVSMGVQDFDARVQEDINRVQPFVQVKEVNEWCRELKFKSVNFDLIYGLPYQTTETFGHTVDQVVSLRPDRIALYSFAYVPWLSKPQNKFNLDAVPLHDEKLEIFIRSRDQLISAGYQPIAMDHFALKTDDMARAFNEGTLHRNFMGYTLKPADEFMGLGVSAIGFLENTYAQNVKVLPEYYERLKAGLLPVERGKILTDDDRLRQWVINRLMCAFAVDKREFFGQFGLGFDGYFAEEAEHIRQCMEDGLIEAGQHRIIVTESGKIFIRNVCMGFDWYLRQKQGHKRFSKTV